MIIDNMKFDKIIGRFDINITAKLSWYFITGFIIN